LQLKVFDNNSDNVDNQNINYDNCKKYCESNDECKMCVVDKFDLNNKNKIVAFGIKPNNTIIQGNDYPIKNCVGTILTRPAEQLVFYKSPPTNSSITMAPPVMLQATPLQQQVAPLQTPKPFCNKIDIDNNVSTFKFKRCHIYHSRKHKNKCNASIFNNMPVVLI
jgi:hypothetical protein